MNSVSENAEKNVPDAAENTAFANALAETLPLGHGVKIAAADARGIFAFDKPAGMLTHPNAPGLAAAKNSLLHADYSAKNECFACRIKGGKIQKIFLLNRLDSPTSGLVLAATDAAVAAAAKNAFSAGTVHKIYFAIVFGAPPVPASGVWENFLCRARGRDGALRVEICRANVRGALFARTHYATERTGTFALDDADARSAPSRPPSASVALLRLEPETGRTHQLRVQCAARKIPILGDKNYGNFRANARVAEHAPAAARNRLFLHAAETVIAFPMRGGATFRFVAKSPLPPIFSEIFSASRGAGTP